MISNLENDSSFIFVGILASRGFPLRYLPNTKLSKPKGKKEERAKALHKSRANWFKNIYYLL